MSTERQDTAIQDGCDRRCTILRYRLADEVNGPIYIKMDHSWEAHNAHNAVVDAGLTVYEVPGLRVNFEEMEIVVNGLRYDSRNTDRYPTPKEWAILRVLVRSAGKVVLQDTMLRAVWGESYADAQHLLRVNMARLRRKLDEDKRDRFITTIPGIGYRILAMPERRNGTKRNGVAHQNGHAAVAMT